MPIRPFMRGPMGGYVNQPELIAESFAVDSGSKTITIRPPVGQIWAPTLVQIYIQAYTAAATAIAYIALYDGTTAVMLDRADATLGMTVGQKVQFASGVTGPIRLTHDKWMILTISNSGGNITTYAIASIDKVI